MADIKEFINPKSMLTPGLAGGITMMIANSLWVQFALPQKWTALVISFLFGAIVFSVKNLPPWQRSIYYILNSLIIFSMGVGVNTVGGSVASKGEPEEPIAYFERYRDNAAAFILPSVWAQQENRHEQHDREIEMLERRLHELRKERDTAVRENERSFPKEHHMEPEARPRSPVEINREARPEPEPEPKEPAERQFFQGWFR